MQERRLLLVIGLVQFINILDFMMVMPLGPDLAKGLGVPVHLIGIVAASYTLAAAVVGFAGLFFLDRFQRRPALLVLLAGLVLATAAAAASWNLHSLMAARILAGLFGGPLSAIGMAIIADEIPPERRGQAMGKVMGAFAVASVLGVPFGLELAGRFSWHMPFIVFGIGGTLVWGLAWRFLRLSPRIINPRPMRAILFDVYNIISQKKMCLALAYTAIGMMASFMIVPNIAAHLQLNLGYPREKLGMLYLVGGTITFFSMRLAGKMVDRFSATKVVTLFCGLFIVDLLAGFIFWHNSVPVMALFILFMISTTGRNVAGQTLASKLPASTHRAAFMSLNSAITHCATSLGAMISAMFLREGSVGLSGIEYVAMLSIGLSLVLPFLFRLVEGNAVKT